jgi:hypothetical protein
MSNQIGDRYSCSHPNCGCEIEIQRPCNMSSAETNTEERGVRTRDFRSEPVSTVGDDGSQGATGEGVFDGAGAGDRSATASGRYDSESTRVTQGLLSSSNTLRCFCGGEMREIGAGQRRAQATRASSPNR